MNKFLLVMGFVVLVVGIVFLVRPKTVPPVVVPEPVATSTPVATTTLATGSIKNATYSIEGVPVTLVDGIAETPAAPDSASVIHIEYFGNDVTYDFNHDGRMDSAFLLTQSTGGTGVFYYVVVAINTPTGYQGSDGVRLGDRIAPQSTHMNDAVIEVTFADRKEGEPFSAVPSIGKSMRLMFDAATMKLTEVTNQTVATSTTATKLTGKKWQWVRTNYTDGRVFVPKKTTAFSLTFGPDGRVSGTTDCNGLGGPYTVTGTSSLVFGRMAMTMMYCDGSEEGVFADLLGQVTSYRVSVKGELDLVLKAKAGTMIFE